jgi:transcriptional regulator GlxA family with amidase domain
VPAAPRCPSPQFRATDSARSRVFKQAKGMTLLAFFTRERITHAQQLIRETSRSMMEIALEVGYTGRAISRKPFGE